MFARSWCSGAVGFLLAMTLATGAWAKDGGQAGLPQETKATDSGWIVDVVPIYLWVPFNINSVTLPRFPDLPPPPEGDRPTGGTGANLSGAAMAAFRVENGRWMARANVAWAGLAGERERPRAVVSGDIIYGEVMTGVRVVNHLWIEGGVRRVSVNVSAEILDYPKVSRKPGVWDPVLGATFRFPMGDAWVLTIHGDGGGFGVGSEVDAAAAVSLDWRFARHFGVAVGYQFLYLRVLDSQIDVAGVEKTLELGTSFHGPMLGARLRF